MEMREASASKRSGWMLLFQRRRSFGWTGMLYLVLGVETGSSTNCGLVWGFGIFGFPVWKLVKRSQMDRKCFWTSEVQKVLSK